MENDASTLEDIKLLVSRKTKYNFTKSRNQPSRFSPKCFEYLCLHKRQLANIHSRFIHNHKKIESSQDVDMCVYMS